MLPFMPPHRHGLVPLRVWCCSFHHWRRLHGMPTPTSPRTRTNQWPCTHPHPLHSPQVLCHCHPCPSYIPCHSTLGKLPSIHHSVHELPQTLTIIVDVWRGLQPQSLKLRQTPQLCTPKPALPAAVRIESPALRAVRAAMVTTNSVYSDDGSPGSPCHSPSYSLLSGHGGSGSGDWYSPTLRLHQGAATPSPPRSDSKGPSTRARCGSSLSVQAGLVNEEEVGSAAGSPTHDGTSSNRRARCISVTAMEHLSVWLLAVAGTMAPIAGTRGSIRDAYGAVGAGECWIIDSHGMTGGRLAFYVPLAVYVSVCMSACVHAATV